MSDLRELYQQVILDHNKSPRNFRVMDDATRAIEGYNPLCGDHYTVYVKIKDDVIDDLSFKGSGCAISKASASVMSSVLRGKSIQEAREYFEKFHGLVTGAVRNEAEFAPLERLAPFAGVSEFPARVKCAILPWHALRSALEQRDDTVTTE